MDNPQDSGRILLIGLTGGIGSGKSTVARFLQIHGASIIDADDYARRVVGPNTEALAKIRLAFGEKVITDNHELDRKALARIVFSDPKARDTLEGITHPLIAEQISLELERLQAQGIKVAVYEAALIVEKRLHETMDGLIVVAAPQSAQMERVVRRDHTSEEEVLSRIHAQLPLEEKLKEADWVVDNCGTLEDTERQVQRIWGEIRNATKGAKEARQKKGTRRRGD